MSKTDGAIDLSEIIEKLKPRLSPSEIFAERFELKLAGKMKQLVGKKFPKEAPIPGAGQRAAVPAKSR